MSYPTYTQTRIQQLAHMYGGLTGMDPTVAAAQITAEQGINGNVLGLTVANGSATHVYPGQTGVFQASNGQWLATFPTQELGLSAAAWWLKNPNSPYAAIRNAIATGKAAIQAHALAASGWAGSGGYLSSSAFAPLLSATPGPGTGTAPISSSAVSSANAGGSISLAKLLGISPNTRGPDLWNALKAKIAGSGTKIIPSGSPSDASAFLAWVSNAGGLAPDILGVPDFAGLLTAPTAGSIQVPVNAAGQVDIAALQASNAQTGAMTGGFPTAPDIQSAITQGIKAGTQGIGSGIAAGLQGAVAGLAPALAPLAIGLVVVLFIGWLAIAGVRDLLPSEGVA